MSTFIIPKEKPKYNKLWYTNIKREEIHLYKQPEDYLGTFGRRYFFSIPDGRKFTSDVIFSKGGLMHSIHTGNFKQTKDKE